MGASGHDGRMHWGWRLLGALFFFALPAPVLLLLLFRFVPIPGTPQMLLSLLAGHGAHYSWRGADDISPLLGREVIGAEDQNFCHHHGFDWKSIDAAVKAHERHPHRRIRGASTISQQTARSLFLLPVRSWVRKGAEAASRAYFHRSAASLTPVQAARLAAILPDPHVWKAAHPGPYVARRTHTLLARGHEVVRDGLDFCVRNQH
jgi:monofunctional biosynthetic peptidoglycan transglycosylase